MIASGIGQWGGPMLRIVAHRCRAVETVAFDGKMLTMTKTRHIAKTHYLRRGACIWTEGQLPAKNSRASANASLPTGAMPSVMMILKSVIKNMNSV